jgi:3-oxoadipate enol-lactonase
MAYANGPGGCRIWYDEAGSGEPLLLLPGQASGHRMWDDVLPSFAHRHRVLVYDHRGTGKSDAPLEPPYSIELFAADAIAVLDAAAVSRAHVYGISMGGRIAQRLAIKHPELMGAVVLGATTPGDSHGVRRSAEVDSKFRTAEPAERFRMLIDDLYTLEFQEAHPEAVEKFRTRVVLEPTPPEILRLRYQASQGHEAWEELPSITAPVLVIHGTDDSVNPTANARLLAQRIPGAELRLIDGARHGYHVERHAEATEVVLDFLARHPLMA